MIFDVGKNLGDVISGAFGSVFSDSAKAMKRVGQSADDVARALKIGIFFKSRYKGKKQSLFKSDYVIWGRAYYMRNKKETVDGCGLFEAQQNNARTYTSSSVGISVTASTISTTSTI